MGLVYGSFVLRNPRLRDLPALPVRALVDTGANVLCIPAAVAATLQLEEAERRQITLADGGRHWVPYVGPIQVSFGRRHSFGGAFVLGEEVLVGAIALEDMDLVISPARCTVTVNPASPHVARGCAYGHSEPAAGENAEKQRT